MGAETDSNSLCRCVTCARGRAGRARGCQAAQRPRRARSGPRTAGRRDDRGAAHAGARSGPAARRTWQQTSAKVTSLSSPSALACEPWVLADSCSGSTLCHRGDCPGAGSGGARGAAACRHGGATAGTAQRLRARCEAAEHGPPRPPLAPGGGSGARSRQPWPPTTRRTPSQPARLRRTPALAARSCWFAQGPQTYGVVPEQTRFVGPF